MAHDVFISHASGDKPVADAVCATLEARGVRCWMAPRDVLPGTEWADSIVRAVTESRAMVLVFSSQADASRQVKREVNLAIDKGCPIVPFRIENVMPSGALEYQLDVTHWLDALTPPLEKHLEKLAADVKRLIGDAPSPPPPVPTPRPPAGKNRLLLAAGALLLLALAVGAGFFASRWRDRRGPGNDNIMVVGVTPTPHATPSQAATPTASLTPTPLATPTPRPTPTPAASPTPTPEPVPSPTPTPLQMPPVVALQCAAPFWELRCRGGGPRPGFRGGTVAIRFIKAGQKSPDKLLTGECAWMDRPVGPEEPATIMTEVDQVRELLPFLSSARLLFGFCARNAGDHFVTSKAGRVK